MVSLAYEHALLVEKDHTSIETIKQNDDGEVPLFLSDGWPSYPEILATIYSSEEMAPKYKKYSSVILKGFTNHCLILEELLMCWVPQ